MRVLFPTKVSLAVLAGNKVDKYCRYEEKEREREERERERRERGERERRERERRGRGRGRGEERGRREGGRRGGKADCAGGITDIIALANLTNLKVESPSG